MHNWRKWVKSLLLVAILLLASFLRVGQPGIVEFKRDEANLSLLALDLVDGKQFPFLGIGSSVGIPNAPVNVYVMALPYLFTSNPIFATQFIGFLNVLAVGMVFWVANRYRGYLAGLVAAAFFAVSPWGVIFSRKIWAQNMLPFFVMLVLCVGLIGFIEKKRWAQIAFFPILAITGQIHYGAFVILPMSLLLVWKGRRSLSWLKLCIGLFLALISLIPYATGIYQADLASISRIKEILENSRSSQQAIGSRIFTADAIQGADIIISGRDIHSLTGPERFEEYLASTPDVFSFYRVIPLVVVLSCVWLVMRPNREDRVIEWVFLTGLIFPIVTFTPAWTEFFIHYLIPILPFAYLIMGFAIADLLAQNKRKTINLLLLPVSAASIVLLVSQTISILDLLSFVDKNTTSHGFGTPAHYYMPIRTQLLQENRPTIGKLGETNLITESEPTIWKVLLYDLESLKFEDDNTQIVSSASQVVNILTKECSTPAEATTYPLRSSEGCYSVSAVSRVVSSDSFTPFSENSTFAAGAQFRGWNWTNQDNCLRLWWTILKFPDDNYNFAVQFLDGSETAIASGDRITLPKEYWWPGDHVISQFCISEENALSTRAVRLGMYRFLSSDTIINSDLIDAYSNPTGQYLLIHISSQNISHSQ